MEGKHARLMSYVRTGGAEPIIDRVYRDSGSRDGGHQDHGEKGEEEGKLEHGDGDDVDVEVDGLLLAVLRLLDCY